MRSRTASASGASTPASSFDVGNEEPPLAPRTSANAGRSGCSGCDLLALALQLRAMSSVILASVCLIVKVFILSTRARVSSRTVPILLEVCSQPHLCSAGQARPSVEKILRGFKQRADAQQFDVSAELPDQLDADRQAVRIKAAGQTDRRMTGHVERHCP